MPHSVRALRGATTIDVDTTDQVVARVTELLGELMDRNGIQPDQLVSAMFTGTPDIRSCFPATAARHLEAFADVALLGAQEMDIDGGAGHCIRVMLHVETATPRADLQHVYLHGAAALRPDLSAS